MGVIDRVADFFALDVTGLPPNFKPPGVSITDWVTGHVYELDAMADAVVGLIASQVAATDLRALDRATLEVVPPGDQSKGARFNRLMQRGVDNSTAADWKAKITTDIHIFGNSYQYIEEDVIFARGRPQRLLRDLLNFPPQSVRPYRRDDGRIGYKGENEREIPPERVVHIRMPGRSDSMVQGRPPLAYSSGVLQMAQLANAQVLANLRNKLSPIAVAYDDASNDQKKLSEFEKENIVRRGNPWRLMQTGSNPELLMMTPQTPDMLALRADNRLEIARAYRVPGPLVGIETTQWGSGIEHLKRLFWILCLRPVFSAIESSLSALVWPGSVVRFDELDLIRGDWDSTASIIKALAGNNTGALATIDTLRAFAKLPPMPDGRGDEFPTMPSMQAPNQDNGNATDEPDDDGETEDAEPPGRQQGQTAGNRLRS